MKFDATEVKPHLPYHVAFQINIMYTKHIIQRTIIDEGTSTCVMSLSCWKSIGSPELTPSPTLLTILMDDPLDHTSSFPLFQSS
jgi:hypothetical protein